MTEELFNMCRELTMQDKVELRDFLNSSIKVEKGGVGKTGLRCLKLMQEIAKVMGIQRVSMDSRLSIQVWARTMVAYQMMREGYSNNEIGMQMGKSAPTISHLKDKMRSAMDYPKVYEDVLEIWNNFQKRIENGI